jgi:hypothetical protein
MIKTTIIENRYNLNAPFFEAPESWVEQYGGQIMPGSSVTYENNAYKRTIVNWFFSLEDFNNFIENAEVAEQWKLRVNHNMENNIVMTRILQKVLPEEYDSYVLAHPKEPTT